jgi:hypothetical protein
VSSRNRTDESSNPTPSSDHVSAEAPGVRTEGEVLAAEQAAAEQAANQAPPGATGSALANATDEEIAAAKAAAEEAAKKAGEDEEAADRGKLIHFRRISDGTVQSVNPGTHEHQHLIRGVGAGEWEPVSRSEAKRFEPRTFVSSAKRAAAQERAKKDAEKAAR